MMKKHKLIGLVLTGVCLLSAGVTGQPSGRQENVALFTDRTLYVTGEQILFSGMLRSESDSVEKILYVELVTPDGRSITGGKFSLENRVAHGCLHIPGEVISGNYYLRAYTRFMRNFGSAAFAHVPLKLVNPGSSNVLTLANRADEAQNPPPAAIGIREDIFLLSSDKSVYRSREKAILTIRWTGLIPAGSIGMCISVIPENTLINGRFPGLPAEENPSATEKIYKMETRGVSISGQLLDASGTPVQEGIVTLSVMGDKDFSAYRTDRQGRYYFTLPAYFGSRDLFLSATGLDQHNTSLLIDNDFSTVPVKLPNPPFRLSDEEKGAAYNLAVNQMVTSEYEPVLPRDTTDSLIGEKRPFYGQPTETLLMDKFVQLPTLEEYFNELPVDVRVRERKEGKYFKFNSANALMIANDPLVMVDWVAITDVGKLMQLAPQRIEKIEIVNKPYIKGNLTYGGIISILSPQGDFAGIDLPASGLFLKYDLLSPSCGKSISHSGSSNLPDARNTVFWLPFWDAGAEMKNISVDLPDTPGNYQMVIRGVLSDGTICSQALSFRVE